MIEPFAEEAQLAQDLFAAVGHQQQARTIDDILWRDATAVHHAFQLRDKDSGRVLEDTLEIHTLELPRYNVKESELSSASELDCWLFWLLHAHEYEPEVLAALLPPPTLRASQYFCRQPIRPYSVRC